MTEGAKEQGRGVGGTSARAATWIAWSLVALSVALLVGGIVLSRAATIAVPDLPFAGETEDGSAVANLVTLLPFSVVGAIIASRHPRNAIGWLFCSVGVTIGLNSFAGDYAGFWLASGFGTSSLGETAAWFSSWLWILLVYAPTSFLLLLFPDGRLPSPRWRPVSWGVALGTAGGVVGYALRAGPLEDFPQIANPYGVGSTIVGIVGVAGSILATGSMVASAVSLIVRLRHAGSAERQQIKWLAYGGAVVVATICVGALIIPWSVPVSILVMSVALLGLPVFTGIAIVRHRLYDIDLLINRTIVYASLTAILVLLYVGGVVSLQYAFRAVTGHESQLAVVASTLVIAALFTPLRERIQSFIDRGASIAAGTTRERPWKPSLPSSGTRRTWKPSTTTWWVWWCRPCNLPMPRYGCVPRRGPNASRANAARRPPSSTPPASSPPPQQPPPPRGRSRA